MQDEIRGAEGDQAVELDLEVGGAIAVGIPFDDGVGADEAEGLAIGGGAVGIDGAEVDVVAGSKADDLVAGGGQEVVAVQALDQVVAAPGRGGAIGDAGVDVRL